MARSADEYLALMRKRLATLYRCDNRDRILAVNYFVAIAAPRFHLMRTAFGNIARYRSDVPDDLVAQLDKICTREPIIDPPTRLPALYDEYLNALGSRPANEDEWSGPAYMIDRDTAPLAPPIAIDDTNAQLLRSGLDAWLPDVQHSQPLVAVVAGGRAVSLCASVRISAAVHCAGVETLPEYRRRGYAVSAVAAWARAVRARGAMPFYSTSWDSVASQAVAARLGASLAGVDFHVG
jgi:GNAT superfamily N-acetyltransferase